MAKSMCNGCKYWVRYKPSPYAPQYDAGIRFYYCDKLEEHRLAIRKAKCNGKYKEK